MQGDRLHQADPKPMTDGEFILLKDLISREVGIILKDTRRPMLEARVSQRLGVLKLSSYRDYADFILSDPARNELYVLAAHITNKETYFFREKQQFDIFKILLADMKEARQRQGRNCLRFLSLACATGEEAYSMNMVIQESGYFLWDWDIRVIGIDIDSDALATARQGVYGLNSFRAPNGGGVGIIERYFTRENEKFALKKYLQKNVEFRQGNLLSAKTYTGLSDIDAIFCRNVMIYMGDETIRTLAAHLYGVLSDSGSLFVGSSESLTRKTDLFFQEQIHGAIVYRKNPGKKPAG